MLSVGFVKPLMIALGVLSLITVGVFYWGQAQKRLAEQYGYEVEQGKAMLSEEREDKERILSELSKVRTEYKQRTRDLKNALDENPGWSDTPVPTAVVNQLCDQDRCITK